MGKDAYYFKHDSNARNDLKLKAVFRKYGSEGYGWYWIILENLRETENYQIEYSDFVLASLAEDMRTTLEKTKEFIDYCSGEVGLFVKTEGVAPNYFYSMSMHRRMAKLNEIRDKRSKAGSWDRNRVE